MIGPASRSGSLARAHDPAGSMKPRARRARLLPALALLLGALSPFAAAPAAAAVLVSTIGQTVGSSNFPFSDEVSNAPGSLQGTPTDSYFKALSQAFTTGSATGGYLLSDIEVRMQIAGTGSASSFRRNFQAELWSAAAGGGPGVKLASLAAPAGVTAGANRVVKFTAPSGTVLSPATTYYLVLYRTDRHEDQLRSPTSTAEDTGGAAGWSIADNPYEGRTGAIDTALSAPLPSSVTWHELSDHNFMIRVNGSPSQNAPDAPGAPTGLSAAPGIGAMDLSWTAPPGTVTDYEVHYTSEPGSPSDEAASGSEPAAGWVASPRGGGDTAAAHRIAGLTGATLYRVRVRAVNAGAAGPWAFASGTAQAPPDRATGTVWSATLTVRDLPGNIAHGCADGSAADPVNCANRATLSGDGTAISAAGVDFRLASVTVIPSGIFAGSFSANFAGVAASDVAPLNASGLNFCVGQTAFPFSGLRRQAGTPEIQSGTALRWSPGDQVFLSIGPSCPPVPAAPSAPRGLGVAPSSERLALSWTAPAGRVTGYDVHYTSALWTGQNSVADAAPVQTGASPSPASGWVDAGHSGTAASLTISGLTDNTYYRVRMRAKNAGGASPWAYAVGTPRESPIAGTVWSATLTPAQTFSQATNLFVGCNSENAPTADDCSAATVLTEDGFTANGVDYTFKRIQDRRAGALDRLDVSIAPAPGAALRELTFCSGTTGYPFSDSNGALRSPDFLWVSTDAGWSVGTPVSLSIGRFCQRDVQTASRLPTGLAVTPGDEELALSWTAPSGAVTGYDVHYTAAAVAAVANDAASTGSDAHLGWVAVGRDTEASPPVASQTIPHLAPGTTYRVRVRAYDAGASLASAWVHGTGTPPVAQPPPTGLTVTPGDSKLDVSWTAPAGSNLSYDVEYTSAPKTGQGAVADSAAASGTDASLAWVDSLVTSVTSHTISGLTPGTAYRVRVNAYNGATGLLSAWVFGTGTPPLPAGTLWQATLRPGGAGAGVGCTGKADCDSRLSDNSFTVGGTEYGFELMSFVSGVGLVQMNVNKNSNAALRALNFCTGSVSVRMNQPPRASKGVISSSGHGFGWVLNTDVVVRIGSNCAGAASAPSAPAITDVTAGDRQLNVVWTAPTQGSFTGFEVEYKAQSAPDQAATTAGDPTTGWVQVHDASEGTAHDSELIIGLEPGETYDVRVRAVGPGGNSAWATGTGMPPADTTGPAAPTFDPADGATVTGASGDITLTFAEAVKRTAANEDFTTEAHLKAVLTLKAGSASGADIGYSASIDNTANTVITIAPSSDLANGDVYVAVSDGYFDAAGNQGTAASATFTVAVPAGTPAVSLSAAPNPVPEGASTTVTATLSGALPAAVTIPLTLTPAAGTTSSDYGTLTSVRIAAGTTSGTGRIATRQDDDTDDETFTVALDAAKLPSSVTAGSPDSVTITIDDDDAPVTVTLSGAPNPVKEGESVTVTATLSGAAPRTVTLPVTVTPGTAEAGDLGTLSNIRIARGQTSGTGRLATRQDDDIDDETFTVALDAANLPAAFLAGAATSVALTIDDDDTPTVSLVPLRHPVTAGESATITVKLSAALPGAVTIPLTLTPEDFGGGTTRSDYGTLASIRIAAGATRGSGTITTRGDNDTVVQRFRVALGTLPAQVQRGTPQWVRVTIAPRPVPIVWLTTTHKTVNEGGVAIVTAHLTEALSAAVEIPVTATLSDGPPEAHKIPIAAGATSGAYSIGIPHDDDAESETLIVAIDTRWLVAVEPQVRIVRSSDRPSEVVIFVRDIPALSAEGGSAREGRDEAVTFTVRLSYTPLGPDTVRVRYTTVWASSVWRGALPATPGADYTDVWGTVAFLPGERAKTVSVPVLDDAIDEGTEHFLLALSGPEGGAYVKPGRGEAHGLITNDDHLQAMWLARFGRTMGRHLTDAVGDRLAEDLAPGAHATVAGQRLDLAKADDAEALAGAVTGLARAFGAEEAPAVRDDDPFARPRDRAAAWNDPTAAAPRSMTGRELLLGSAFQLATDGGGAAPDLAAWGRVAHGRFDGEHADDTGATGVDGEVLTGTLGADADFGRVLAGVAVSLSEGDGTFASPGVDTGGSGAIESTMTTVSPYLRLKLTERVSAWGLAGWGTGDMTIRFDDGAMAPVRTDIGMRIGALGARGALLEQDETGGMDLALKADAFFVALDSEKAANSAEVAADASQVRLVLEGGRAFALSDTATLRPSLELGVRHDGGDAETGAGLELGGGVAFTDAASGLSVEAKARVLAAHADAGYEEWGMSATARLDPGARGRGLSFSLTPTIGTPSSATGRLWGAERPRELAPGGGFEAARGLEAHAGYGLPLFGGRFTGTPNAGLGLADGGLRDYRVGWRLTSAAPGGPGLEVNLDAVRREAANDAAPEHGVMLRGALRW